MTEENEAAEPVHYRLRREADGAWATIKVWFLENWQGSKKFKIAASAVGGLLLLYALIWLLVLRNLPSANTLIDYQPPLPSMVRGVDGEIVYSYARERRVQLRFGDFPKPLINAFLSAEDKNFWSHSGVDYGGLAQAVVDYATKLGSGQRARGGSTITQQVAKNILIGNEYSVGRKLKEMVLARRIERVLSKEQILELYLNEIPLGRQTYGVQAAARAYFGKDVGDLQLHEAAFLAVLPKAPETYGRTKYAEKAMERRNWVLEQMVKNGHANRADVDRAKAQPLGIIAHRVEAYDSSVGYFVEEVRRILIDRYGESADDGPNSVYAGGLWVRTSLDPEMQKATQDALRAGLLRYASGRAWIKPIAHIEVDPDRWQTQLLTLNKSISYDNWRIGLVVERKGSQATIGFADGATAALIGLPDAMRQGDVIAASPVSPAVYAVRVIPEVSGGMLVQNPHSGRVLAMQGGFDQGIDSFNRATQAERQPGSTIKPFVYATALDFGQTPSTMVPDQSFCVYQSSSLGQKCFKNFGGGGGGGVHTMRWGLEQSRNLMTVHIANDAGMKNVVHTFDRVGIGKFPPYLAYSLGAGETTVGQMVNAYSALANQGLQYDQSLIDFIQDRTGKVIWRADQRRCNQCNMAEWDGKPMPRLALRGRQVLDARSAFQTVHMLEGVITRGTAVVLKDLNLPIFGKTGTTSGPTNVWFVGGSRDYISGVYLGYDQPRSLGAYAQGGTIAAPMFKQLVRSTRARWSNLPFNIPANVHMIKVDRASGKQVFGGTPGNDPQASIIWEAFKAETELPKPTREDLIEDRRNALINAIKRSQAPRAVRQAAPSGDDAVTGPEPAPAPTADLGGVY